MLEAHRVLRMWCLLVMDSPNRLITAQIGGAHPEHVIEFTPAEARQLAEAAGFDVLALRGLWLCAVPQTGKPLPVGEGDTGAWTYERRIVAGLAHPEQSYVWWLEATRSDRSADPVAVRAIVDRAYNIAWPERLTRFSSIIGIRKKDVTGQACFEITSEGGGVAMFGPYAPLTAGRYAACFSLSGEANESGEGRMVRLEVFSESAEPQIITSRDVMSPTRGFANPEDTVLKFDLPELVFGIQFRVSCWPGAASLRVRADVELSGPN
jgi:hypothetical protein